MEAIQASTGESRPVVRVRRGVVWCPFCDRSRLVATTGPICAGCGAEFVEAVVIEEPAVVVDLESGDTVAEDVEEGIAYQDDKAINPSPNPRRKRNK